VEINKDIKNEVLRDYLLVSATVEGAFQDFFRAVTDDSDAESKRNTWHRLLRTLETCKENFVYCELVDLSRLLNHISKICDSIFNGMYHINGEISEALLQSLDCLRQSVEALLHDPESDVFGGNAAVLDALLRRLSSHVSQVQADEIAAEILLQTATNFEVEFIPRGLMPQDMAGMTWRWSDYFTDAESAALQRVLGLIEQRNPFWRNRGLLQIGLVLDLNRCMNQICDARQLIVAVAFHDIGMMFLPDSILLKTSHLDDDEMQQVRQHTLQPNGFFEFFQGFEQAWKMIEQHHERYDGQGYPHQLRGHQIVVGAQLIAVADAYYSMTHQRADRTFHRSLARSMMEVSNASSFQFSPDVVAAFNHVIHEKIRQLNIKS
jgi:hypothetical protein